MTGYQKSEDVSLIAVNVGLPGYTAIYRLERDRIMDKKFADLTDAIQMGDVDEGLSAVRGLLKNGTEPVDIFSECVEPVLNKLGEQFAVLEIFLPDLMVAGDVVNAIQDEIAPLLEGDGKLGNNKGRAVIGTVYGDLHDIGKNMVSLMMRVNGFEMYDLGVDVSPVALVKKAEEVQADLLCLSGLMMPSMPYMRETIEMVKQNSKLAGKIKVVVGGGPVTEQWANDHGADGYADDAMGAVKKALELVG